MMLKPDKGERPLASHTAVSLINTPGLCTYEVNTGNAATYQTGHKNYMTHLRFMPK
jgi:hypothetical protein